MLMRKTVNSGKTWVAVHARRAAADMFQSSPPPGAVGSILFSGQRDGWAFGPALWRTTDGGATWRRERVPRPVTNLAVAGGRVLAVITATGRSGTPDLRLYAARAGTDDWRAVPGGAVSDVSGASLAVSGRTGYLMAARHDLAKPVLLAGPVSGSSAGLVSGSSASSARWHTVPEPCRGGWSAALAGHARLALRWLRERAGRGQPAQDRLRVARTAAARVAPGRQPADGRLPGWRDDEPRRDDLPVRRADGHLHLA